MDADYSRLCKAIWDALGVPPAQRKGDPIEEVKKVADAGRIRIVSAVLGGLRDVGADVGGDSPPYGQVVTIGLFPMVNALNIPAGVAHGCQALDDGATLMYLLDVGYVPASERGFRVDDP